MPIKVVSSGSSIDLQQRITRMEIDALKLALIPVEEIRAEYEHIERVRDALSAVLDRADGKHAG